MFKRYWWMLVAMAAVGMFAGFLVAGVITYVMPRKFESSTIIEIKPPTNPSEPNLVPQNYFPNELAKIKGRNTLMKVVESLDLSSLWAMGQESAVQLLKQIVTVERIKGTDLCAISVMHTDREVARDIAAGVARAFKDYRRELVAEAIGARVSGMRKVVREQEDRVEERRKILTTIARNNGAAGGGDPADVQYYADTKREFETALSLLEQLKLKLITEEITLDLPDETIFVHEDPVIAATPVSPNVALNLLIGLGAGLMLSPFLSLPMMWFLNSRNESAT